MGNVADVRTAARLTQDAEDIRDGFRLSFHWPRGKVVRRCRAPFAECRFFASPNHRVVFAVEACKCVKFLEQGDPVARLRDCEIRIIASPIRQEGLECERAFLGKPLQSFTIRTDKRPPESEIDIGASSKIRFLRTENIRIVNGRLILHGHVDDGRDAARRSRTAAVREIFPPGIAGIVEMHMVVDAARKDIPAFRIEHLRRLRYGCTLRMKSLNAAIHDTKASSQNLTLCHKTGIRHQEIEHDVISSSFPMLRS